MGTETPVRDDGAPALARPAAKTYTCGTLTYTKSGLAMLFFWLIWGDVCFTLFESVTDPIMKLKFKEMGAMNWEIALILGMIPTTLYSFLNPVISFKSDRYRSRWGRRIPFILGSMPFLVLSKVGLAYGAELGMWVYRQLPAGSVAPNRVVMWTYGGLIIMHVLCNTFVTTTFWYLFRDIVPEQLLARFMSWFRVVGTVTMALYNFFIFQYVGTHATAIFLGVAVVYLLGFGLMCLNVREGTYAPPPPYVGKGTGPIAMIKTYGKECHSHRIYWDLWLCTFIGSVGAGVATYDLYFKQAIGLDLKQIGRLAGITSVAMAILVLGVGWMADRYHPIRVLMAARILSWFTVIPASMTWIFWHPSREAVWTFHLPWLAHVPWLGQWAVFEIQQVFLISLLIYVGVATPAAALNTMWDPVMLMRIFPQSRLGQFCSTNAIWRSVGGMVGGMLAGLYFDAITPWIGKDRAYFYGPLWSTAFAIPSFWLFVRFYRGWKRHGGDEYVAPVPGEEVLLAERAVEEAAV